MDLIQYRISHKRMSSNYVKTTREERHIWRNFHDGVENIKIQKFPKDEEARQIHDYFKNNTDDSNFISNMTIYILVNDAKKKYERQEIKKRARSIKKNKRLKASREKVDNKNKKKEAIVNQKKVLKEIVNNLHIDDNYNELDSALSLHMKVLYDNMENTEEVRHNIIKNEMTKTDKICILKYEWNKKHVLSIPNEFKHYI